MEGGTFTRENSSEYHGTTCAGGNASLASPNVTLRDCRACNCNLPSVNRAKEIIEASVVQKKCDVKETCCGKFDGTSEGQ